jgi:hypothetical protein
MSNSTTICGNLTREPEIRYTRGGQATTQLGVAVTRRWQCQRPLGIPHWRPLEFPRDGHENSPRTATKFPGRSTGQRHHPLARSGVDQADRFTFGDDDVGMVQEPVNESRGDGLVHELVEA